MNITVSDVDDVKVLLFEGKLDTKSSPDAQTMLAELVERGARKLIVNFENLAYISSSGLRMLLTTARQLKGCGGEIRICGLNEDVQEIFEISGFNTIFAITETAQEALEDF